MARRSLFPYLISIFFIGCATHSPESESSKIELDTPITNSQKKVSRPYSKNRIDLTELINELNMQRPLDDLGYEEKGFNTCQIESNKSENPLCQELFLVQLNFQIMCRNSTGTVSKTRLEPFTTQRLRWRHLGFRGQTQTNDDGYGSLGFISTRSPSRGHLYFYLDNKVARKQFRDNWKLVLPKSWCDNAL